MNKNTMANKKTNRDALEIRLKQRDVGLERTSNLLSILKDFISKEKPHIDVMSSRRFDELVAIKRTVINTLYEHGCKKYHISKVIGMNHAGVLVAISNKTYDRPYHIKKYGSYITSISEALNKQDTVGRKYNVVDSVLAMSLKELELMEAFVKYLRK